MHPWESIHGAFNLTARDLLHVVESFREELRALSEPVEDDFLLCVVLGYTLFALSAQVGRVHHHADGHLTDCVGAQFD